MPAKTQSKAPPAKTFESWDAAAANAEKQFKAGKISKAEYDKIMQQAKDAQATRHPFLRGINRE